MLRSRLALLRPLCHTSPTSQLFRSPAKRFASSKPSSSKPNPDRGPRFRNFIALGIVSYVILDQVIAVVQKENPNPKTMSESEHFKQQMKLKRRKAIFSQDDKQVWFIKAEGDAQESLKGLNINGFEVIDPSALIEREKKDEESLFNALLNDPETKKIPTGLLVDLILKELQKSSGKKFVVINYPTDIKESVKFEEKVVTIKKLIHLANEQNGESDDVVKYYKTVNKVDEFKTTQDIIKSLE